MNQAHQTNTGAYAHQHPDPYRYEQGAPSLLVGSLSDPHAVHSLETGYPNGSDWMLSPSPGLSPRAQKNIPEFQGMFVNRNKVIAQ